MQEEEVRINSVSEFIEKIVQLDKEEGTEIFYRGHADKNWELLPSIFRTPNGVEKEHLLFRDMVAHEPQSFSECKSALDYLVQMQHYGLPTRLLDMTTNPLVALYFACQSADDDVAAVAISGARAGLLVIEDLYREKVAPENLGQAVILSGLLAAVGAKKIAVNIATRIFNNGSAFKRDVELATEAAVKAGNEARDRDGVVYLFSVSEGEVKHFDSDTISALANLAKCKISEQCSAYLSVEDFNEQPDIKFLLHQIKGEKPHFLPRIQPCDLSSLIFVKAKNGNQRIANQMGAFLLFGLGLTPEKRRGRAKGARYLAKNIHAEIPEEWIKKKLIIPKECKADILKELALLGITDSYIYPGMEQYAKELKKKYEL
jgi:FRG domain protein